MSTQTPPTHQTATNIHLDPQRLGIELQRMDWAREVPQEALQEIAACAELKEYQSGAMLIELDTEVNNVYFVVNGRLRGSLFDRLGKEIQRDTFSRGSVVGLFSVMIPDKSYVQVEALEHSTVIVLTLDDLLRLTSKYREFQIAMFRVTANIFKRMVMVDRELPKPATVGVLHHSDVSRPVTIELTRRLQQLGETPAVAGDDAQWRSAEGISHGLIIENGVSIGQDRINQMLQGFSSSGRLFVDVRVDIPTDDLQRVLRYCEVILWCVRPDDAAKALEILKNAERSIPRLREKVCLVWVLSCDAPAPPFVAELSGNVARDFKTCSGDLGPNQGPLLHQGLERIVRYLRGVQIGLALGGGAARGMAHLGVLKALEEHGIYVDMLAGTSAGAMVGGIYASGMSPEYSTNCFKADLTPSWFFRKLPGGGYWYLFYKYRWGQFGPMLRRYLDHLQMQQLQIPVMMISVDLIDGIPLIRDRGEVTQNILESINLPPLSLPIVHSEQAVVDGGLLNNVPANALVARGCNFVIASTVTAKLEKEFLGIRNKTSNGISHFVGTLQVMMRQNLIQSYNMNAVGVQPADVVIAPDVTSFDLSEFTRADEMSVVGAAATKAVIPQLKAMLSKLDPKLYPR